MPSPGSPVDLAPWPCAASDVHRDRCACVVLGRVIGPPPRRDVSSRMAKIDITKLWGLNYRLIASVIGEVAPALHELGIEVKELFLLAELDAHPPCGTRRGVINSEAERHGVLEAARGGCTGKARDR